MVGSPSPMTSRVASQSDDGFRWEPKLSQSVKIFLGMCQNEIVGFNPAKPGQWVSLFLFLQTQDPYFFKEKQEVYTNIYVRNVCICHLLNR